MAEESVLQNDGWYDRWARCLVDYCRYVQDDDLYD